MQAFVRPVLLRRGGVSALVLNAESHPPHGERGEPAQRLRHEGGAVVAPHRQRESALANRALKHRPREGAVH